jgi:hypothetical protein
MDGVGMTFDALPAFVDALTIPWRVLEGLGPSPED